MTPTGASRNSSVQNKHVLRHEKTVTEVLHFYRNRVNIRVQRSLRTSVYRVELIQLDLCWIGVTIALIEKSLVLTAEMGFCVALDRVVANCCSSSSVHFHRFTQPPDPQLAGAAFLGGGACYLVWTEDMARHRDCSESRRDGIGAFAFWFPRVDGRHGHGGCEALRCDRSMGRPQAIVCGSGFDRDRRRCNGRRVGRNGGLSWGAFCRLGRFVVWMEEERAAGKHGTDLGQSESAEDAVCAGYRHWHPPIVFCDLRRRFRAGMLVSGSMDDRTKLGHAGVQLGVSIR